MQSIQNQFLEHISSSFPFWELLHFLEYTMTRVQLGMGIYTYGAYS